MRAEFDNDFEVVENQKGRPTERDLQEMIQEKGTFDGPSLREETGRGGLVQLELPSQELLRPENTGCYGSQFEV